MATGDDRRDAVATAKRPQERATNLLLSGLNRTAETQHALAMTAKEMATNLLLSGLNRTAETQHALAMNGTRACCVSSQERAVSHHTSVLSLCCAIQTRQEEICSHLVRSIRRRYNILLRCCRHPWSSRRRAVLPLCCCWRRPWPLQEGA